LKLRTFFSNAKIFINLKRCHLQLKKNLEKLNFVNKNWPNDAMVGYKVPNNLVELIDVELDLKQELDEFRDSFEQDELKND